ncbi:uncharacterized protein LOC110891557 [Helianthus annuus]|uniref:uncharacterized protein LOC110891557 n=1 Tax=Helianthus annuus TaxID=4232 RepID=UPI001652CDB9|nr:uncharacterized protein LOC110891557 [Helianthus annuus]
MAEGPSNYPPSPRPENRGILARASRVDGIVGKLFSDNDIHHEVNQVHNPVNSEVQLGTPTSPNLLPEETPTCWFIKFQKALNANFVQLCTPAARTASQTHESATQFSELDFKSTNNEAEYDAFLADLRLAIKIGAKNEEAHVDSLLVAEQINGCCDAKAETMALYLEQARTLINQFQTFKIIHTNKSKNKHADALSKLAATSFKYLAKEVRFKVLSNPFVPLRHVNMIEIGDPSWMSPIIMFLKHGTLLEGKTEARKIQNKALIYEMADGILYRKYYMGPFLRCVDKHDMQYMVRDIHEGLWGIHAGPRMVVAKIISVGYYWPGMHLDAVEILRKCASCQRHAPKTLRPKNPLVPVTAAWPFQQWGIDLVGPFPDSHGTVKFIIVAVDYFTKWVEAKALASTTAMENGQVESVNKQIVDGIKARLGTARRGWVDELPSILWVHRTMPKTSTGETPFSPVYGTEAVIPAEIGLPSPRMLAMEKQNNEQERRLDLDLLVERRENEAINEAKCKSKLEKYYNASGAHMHFPTGRLRPKR